MPSDKGGKKMEKIYVHVIEGTDTWIPVQATESADNQFTIMTFDDFDPEDSSLIPQFIPGDIVTRKLMKRNEEEFWVADKLIESSGHKDKKYFDFLYRTVTGDKLKDSKERTDFGDIIKRTRDEINNGTFHYPAIVNYVKGVETR